MKEGELSKEELELLKRLVTEKKARDNSTPKEKKSPAKELEEVKSTIKAIDSINTKPNGKA